ncbi:MAG: RagB/SusD family nutrient uptake outer membrane protein [Phocaeicola sp.]|nr:RagB/SusD family nutrient uptake outer membrane protein [Phocaeicola sp.]
MLNKYKSILASCFLASTGLFMTSCEDFLDLAPQDQVTPEVYFQNAEQLGAYAISQYNNLFTSPSGWSQGAVLNGDANTDNMVAGAANQSRFTKKYWTVPQSGDLGMGLIRYCNYFFETVMPKYEAGVYESSKAEAEHYIGEMYFIRAWVYFSRLKAYGDYPIITKVLTDNKDELIANGKRMPRNEVADFILSDLDNAIRLLQDKGFKANNRINKQVALLVKSRVALYEASFEKFHKGTGRVPGDAGWPGEKVHPNYQFDVDAHINSLLAQAMEAAKQVADKVTLTSNTMVLDQNPLSPSTGWNPYFEMFASQDLSGIDEVLMWKDYGSVGTTNITSGVSAYIVTGSYNGLLKGYVESFLMEDGLPIYASSTEKPYKGDNTLDDVKANRDGRLQLFVFGESNNLPILSTGNDDVHQFLPVLAPKRANEMGDMTGYRMRKGESFDKTQNVYGKAEGTIGQILFRGVEAHLNYIEAQYLKDGNIDETSKKYWRLVRERAGVDPDYNKTIAATNMNIEAKGDWGAYSQGKLIDATMYNIRRERRCEFIGEAMRWDDLVRWSAMDQLITTPFIPEGCNFWTSMYEKAIYDGEGYAETNIVTYIEGPDNEKANISSKSESKYIRPYRILRNNPVFDGYTWMNAHYNSPIPIREIELLSPDESVDTSVFYQTWGWPTVPNIEAEK